MSYTDRHIVETYSILFEGLSSLSKIELIEKLSKSLKKEINKFRDTIDYKIGHIILKPFREVKWFILNFFR